MTRVLVTDGEERASLAIVRSLGRAGYHVEVTQEGPRSLAGASRHATRHHVVPPSLSRTEAFASAVLEICSSREIDLLLAVTDNSLSALLPARERMGATRFPFPEAGSYAEISNKRLLLEKATGLGIPVPPTLVVPERPGTLIPPDLPPAPWVCKPFSSIVRRDQVLRKMSVSHAASEQELMRTLRSYPSEAYPVLVQQYTPGQGEGVFLLLWEGTPLATFGHRRIREKPPTGGVSVYRESARPDPGLVNMAVNLLADEAWTGVAMVEFRRSSRDGKPYLMEVNGRFWGSLQLAIDSGVDFPVLLARLAMDQEIEPNPVWAEGVRSRWLLGDLDHLILRLKNPYAPDELPAGSAPSRLRALMHFLRIWWPGDRLEVLRVSDPIPWLHELRLWFREAVS